MKFTFSSPDQEIEHKGDYVIRTEEQGKCATCGELCNSASISFCTRFCSTECLDKCWNELFEDMEKEKQKEIAEHFSDPSDITIIGMTKRAFCEEGYAQKYNCGHTVDDAVVEWIGGGGAVNVDYGDCEACSEVKRHFSDASDITIINQTECVMCGTLSPYASLKKSSPVCSQKCLEAMDEDETFGLEDR